MPDSGIITAIGALLAAVSVGALLKVVSRFLRHIEMKDELFTTFLGNHMSKNTESLDNLAAASRELVDRVEQLHEDNLHTRAALEKSREPR